MSFESYSQSGSMIGGEVKVSAKIYLNDGTIVEDIRIGIEIYTTWAYEKNIFNKGETVAECMARHNKSVKNIERIEVSTVDTTGDKEVHEVFSWTKETGWKKTEYKEVYY